MGVLEGQRMGTQSETIMHSTKRSPIQFERKHDNIESDTNCLEEIVIPNPCQILYKEDLIEDGYTIASMSQRIKKENGEIVIEPNKHFEFKMPNEMIGDLVSLGETVL